MSYRTVAVSLGLLLVSQPAFSQPAANSADALRGKSLVCGGDEIRFAKNGSVAVYREGKNIGWNTDAKHVKFGRNKIVFAPKGSQDYYEISYRFGKYYLGDDLCQIR